jgi:tRNA modification GTPase
LIEARIDFADEGDVPEDLMTPALEGARALRDEIATALSDQRRGERLREGLVVAIAGPPNAGKSSLINRIARREAAIVSPYAGTTRDVIEVHLDLGGAPVMLLDTAGIRESDDPVEQEGVRRARARAADADLVLWVVDATAKEGAAVGEGAATGQTSAAGTQVDGGAATWTILNKIDLFERGINEPASLTKDDASRSFAVSARTGEGLAELLGALERFAADFLDGAEPVLITRERHRLALQEALAALDRAQAEPPFDREEIVAEELRLAARALGRLVGRVDVEDILDVIFRDFCIGK